MRLALDDIFTRRGIPKVIKVDNGRPFGDPTGQRVPLLALWLAGLGVDVVWNRPRTPQDNAKVERSQGTLGVWTEYEKCLNVNQLRETLRREAHFYNHDFGDRRQNGTRRIERFPTMETTGRDYKRNQLCTRRVKQLLAKGMMIRRVSKVGQLHVQSHRFSIGQEHRGRQFRIRFDDLSTEWVLTDMENRFFGRVEAAIDLEWVLKKLPEKGQT